METCNEALYQIPPAEKTSCSTKLGIYRQYFAASVVTIGIFGLGTVLAWTSPALPAIEASGELGIITYKEKAWIGSMSMLGALTSSTVSGICVEKFGRKNTMIILAFPFILGWVIIGSATYVELVYMGRFITGFTAGGFSLAVPIFISEMADDHIRGILSSLFQLMMVLGILFIYVVGSYVTWQALAFISCIFPAIFLVAIFFIPETPRYCIAKGRLDDAVKSYAWYRGIADIESVRNEWLKFNAQKGCAASNTPHKIGWREILSRNIIHPVLICLSLMLFEQLSGFNAVIFYTASIFKAAGSDINANLATIIIGIVQVIATVVSSLLVDKAGRRILLIFSEIVMMFSLLALGSFFYFKSINNGVSPAGFGWVPITSLIIFIIAFAQGIGPLSWTIMGEILPPHLKGACSSVAVFLVWFGGFLVTIGYEHLLEALGIYWCFWLFAIFCAMGTVCVTLFVPETKGKSLDEIQGLFSKHSRDVVRNYSSHSAE